MTIYDTLKSTSSIEVWMSLVFEEVEKAIASGNGPFGAALITPNGSLAAVAHNQSYTKNCAIEHAEIEVIRLACRKAGTRTLLGYHLYVNAEPCAMCAAALIKVGVSHVFYGAPAENDGNPCLSLSDISKGARTPLVIQGGVMVDLFKVQLARARQQSKSQRPHP
ncbi:MAG: nucleoside deaminase [Alphaproteobacteria bacterium]|nr:nucleoside deaminase [Alphaproteobacteria bacterium]